jgi:hypothetical protein
LVSGAGVKMARMRMANRAKMMPTTVSVSLLHPPAVGKLEPEPPEPPEPAADEAGAEAAMGRRRM